MILFILILLLIVVSVLMFKVKIKFVFGYFEGKINFNVYLFRFNLTKFFKREKDIKTSNQNRKINTKISFRLLRDIFDKIKVLRVKPIFIVENCLEFGFDESNIVALVYGYASIIIYSLMAFISRYVNLKKTKVSIVPRYNINFLKFYFEGILKIRIVQIIYISFLFITLGRKLNESAPNWKFNEIFSWKY